MTTTSDFGYEPAPKQVQAERVVPSKREAPVLPVSYRCPNPKCNRTAVLDAYQGPPSCKNNHPLTFMDALFISRAQ